MTASASKSSSKVKVDIFSFEDQCAYLSAVLEKTKSLSLRGLASKAGFASPASLSLIMNGKRRMTTQAAQNLAKALRLTGRRYRYLVELGRLDRAKDENEKNAARKELFRLRAAGTESNLKAKQYRCLASWYSPVIYVLIGQKGFVEDPEWIQSKLGGEVSAEQILSTLRDLEEAGLVKRKSGKLAHCSGPLTTEDDIKSAAAHEYHLQMIERAKQAMALPLPEREFNGLTISVPESKLPVLKKKLREFRTEINEYFGQFSDATDVYQVNLQVFPLTTKEKKS